MFLILYLKFLSFINCSMFSFFLSLKPWIEYTTEVSLLEIGKKAIGPFFVKI